MRGRKPQSIASASGVIRDVPRPPAWLSQDARKEWRRVAPLLVERGILTEADLGALEGYVTAHARTIEAERTIRSEGATYLGTSGPKRHPAVTTQDAALKTMRLFASELGLTPVSRSRPSIRADDAPSPDDDDLDV